MLRHELPTPMFAAIASRSNPTQTVCLPLEEAMPKPNLLKMDVDALTDLRKRVDERLLQHRAELQKQLDMLEVVSSPRAGRKRTSPLKGAKVAPKYRGPSGETWAGRGARPRWLVDAMKKSGKKLDAYLIDKSARKGRKKRKTKRRSR
jgi:DNA-binding protein H-NS